MFYICILYSLPANKLFVGQTADIQKQLWEYNNPVENQNSLQNFYFIASC